MTLLISIFGGMALTAALYVGARLARLSNFWAAVSAAGVPTVAYLAYAFSHPVGLDVITLHVITYPTVAFLFAVLNGPKVQRHQTMHWAPKLLIAFFLIMLCVMAGFVYIAGQGLPPALARWLLPDVGTKTIHTGFAGVVEHHQEAAKGVGHRLRMEDKLAKLGWQVVVEGLQEVKADAPIDVQVAITDSAQQPVKGVNVTLALSRPGQGLEERIPLTETTDAYTGKLSGKPNGTWVATLAMNRGGQSIELEHTLEIR